MTVGAALALATTSAWAEAQDASTPAAMADPAPDPDMDVVMGFIAAAGEALSDGDMDGAEARLTEALNHAETAWGGDDLRTARPVASFARFRIEQGRYAEALTLLERAYALTEAQDGGPAALGQLLYDRGRAYDAMGRHEPAETAARASLDLRLAALGPVDEKTADSLNLLANTLAAQGRHAEADPLYRRVLGTYEVLHGPKHPRVAMALSNLANSLRRTGRGRLADPLYRRALSIAKNSDDRFLETQCLTNYGWWLRVSGDPRKAEGLFREALELAYGLVGDRHPFVGHVRANIGIALNDQGRYAEAEPELSNGLRLMQAGLGADSPDLVVTLDGNATALAELERPAEAEVLYRRARAITVERLSPSHSDLLDQSAAYARFLLRQDRPEEALAEVRGSLTALLAREGRGADWRLSVRGAGPLFGRRVAAAWQVAERQGR